MRRFIVVSEEYLAHTATETDPPEYGCDVWEGEAETRAEAKAAAWREWRQQYCSVIDINAGDGLHPMAGVRVIEYLPCALHETILCESCVFTEERIGRSWVLHAPVALQDEEAARRDERKANEQ